MLQYLLLFFSPHIIQARQWNADTAYEVLWVVDCLREFMYDNRGGLDGLSFLHLKIHKQMPIPMLALLLTIVSLPASIVLCTLIHLQMWHFLSQWETGSHNPNKTFGDSYYTLYACRYRWSVLRLTFIRYWSILTGIEDLNNDVPGWFDQHSQDVFVAAAYVSLFSFYAC